MLLSKNGFHMVKCNFPKLFVSPNAFLTERSYTLHILFAFLHPKDQQRQELLVFLI